MSNRQSASKRERERERAKRESGGFLFDARHHSSLSGVESNRDRMSFIAGVAPFVRQCDRHRHRGPALTGNLAPPTRGIRVLMPARALTFSPALQDILSGHLKMDRYLILSGTLG